MSREIKIDSIDQSIELYIFDSVTGLPETAVDNDTAGLALWYRRPGASNVAIAVVSLASLGVAHSDGGLEGIDDGAYRFDLPDAAVVSAVDHIVVGGTATGMVIPPVLINLTTQTTQELNDLLSQILEDSGTTIPALVIAEHDVNSAHLEALSAVLDTILTDTNELQTDDTPAQLGVMSNLLSQILEDTGELQIDDTPTQLGVLSNILSQILADTNELQTDDYPGRFDTLSAAVSVIDANVDAVLVDTGTDGVVVAPGAIGSTQFAAGAITAAAIAADALGASEIASDAGTEIANAVWAKVLESQGSITAQQIAQVTLAVLAGVTSDNGATIKTPDGVTTRVTAVIDGSQNRTTMSLNV